MKRCGYCGRENDDGVPNCQECGTGFAQVAVAEAVSIALTALDEPSALSAVPDIEPAMAGPKKCGYCGREMDSEAAYCPGCGTDFISEEPCQALPRLPCRTLSPEIGGAWSARDAWRCLGMLLVFEVVGGMVLGAVESLFGPFRHFLHTGYGHFFSATLHDAMWVLTVLYFSRCETFSGVLRDFGLKVIPGEHVWFVVAVALGLRLVSHILIVGMHLKGVATTPLLGFARTVGPERFFYLAPALMAAFVEEICLRGFLYTAFRRTYSMQFSMALLLGLTLLTHSSQVFYSAVAFFTIGGIAVIQCYLWERTGNLCNCIILHFVFNLSGAFFSILRAG